MASQKYSGSKEDSLVEKGKMFIGGLNWETTQEGLHRHFSRYGEVVDCVVMKNQETGRSRGFGFVTFADPSCVELVLQNVPHVLDGKTIEPKPCNPRTSAGTGKPFRRNTSGNTVFLGGLPSNFTEVELRNFFSKYGKVLDVIIKYDQEKQTCRGFGFLTFESEESVERCCGEHYVSINGKQVEIKKAEPREAARSLARGRGAWDGPSPGPGIHNAIRPLGPRGSGPPPMGAPGPGGPTGWGAPGDWGAWNSGGAGSGGGGGNQYFGPGPGYHQGWGPQGPQASGGHWNGNYGNHGYGQGPAGLGHGGWGPNCNNWNPVHSGASGPNQSNGEMGYGNRVGPMGTAPNGGGVGGVGGSLPAPSGPLGPAAKPIHPGTGHPEHYGGYGNGYASNGAYGERGGFAGQAGQVYGEGGYGGYGGQGFGCNAEGNSIGGPGGGQNLGMANTGPGPQRGGNYQQSQYHPYRR